MADLFPLSREAIGAIGLGLLFVLILLRIPVGLAMATVGLGGLAALSREADIAQPAVVRFSAELSRFKYEMWSLFEGYDLSVIPLFVLMGYLAARGGLSRDLFNGFNALFGRRRGGVAIAAIGACAGFGAVSGSSLATASTMGQVALPELRRLSYDPALATGVLAAGGTLGILIPPSVVLVLYAIVVEASVLDMFRAALLPGLLAVALFIATVMVLVRLRPEIAPLGPAMAPKAWRGAILRLLPVAAIFGLLIGGLAFGLFLPTPAAGVGAFAVLVYGLAVRWHTGDGLTWTGLRAAVLETAVTAGMIYFILFGARMVGIFFARSNLPQALADLIVGSAFDPYLVLVAILVLFVVLGCVMESLSMVLVAVPFLWPVIQALNGGAAVLPADAAFGLSNADLQIWFGILALVVVELGLITPPVGLNVFIIHALARDVPMSRTFRGVMPFFSVEIVRIALLVAVPSVALLLGRL
ncbi:MAG: TRAP transporter large permease [Alphaproteobacteria bacterium]